MKKKRVKRDEDHDFKYYDQPIKKSEPEKQKGKSRSTAERMQDIISQSAGLGTTLNMNRPFTGNQLQLLSILLFLKIYES